MALKPFPPGVSGNPGGKKRKPMVDRMLEAILTADDSAKAKQVADKLISSALHGSIAATKIVIERTEGRPMRSPAEGASEAAAMTREQIRARLAELLSAPEVRESVVAILSGQAPEGKIVQ
jgi:DNA polymerase elongation subunit (family B)